LYKHYIRIQELNKDLDGISKYTHLQKGFELKGLVVFSNIVPMNFDENRNFIDEINFIAFDDLKNNV